MVAPLDRAILNGSVLASLLHDACIATGDTDGLLFGVACFESVTVLNDSDGVHPQSISFKDKMFAKLVFFSLARHFRSHVTSQLHSLRSAEQSKLLGSAAPNGCAHFTTPRGK